MRRKSFNRGLLLGTALGGIFVSTTVALAAAPADTGSNASGEKIETVVITGMKQGAQAVQDVPASIAVVSGDQLAAQGAVQFSDFAAQVAGLNYADNGPGDKRYIIRGINSAGEAQVAVYYDNIPTTGIGGASTDFGGTQADLGLYDVQQIEVLRGPQGTLYGANSQSGAIHFVTNKPDATKFDASGQLDLSSTQNGGANYGARGMVNIPLIDGKLAVRAVVYRESDSGYIDNTLRNVKGVNVYRNEGARVSVQWNIDDKTTLLGQYFYQNMYSGGRSVERPYGETLFGSTYFPPDGSRKIGLYAFEPRTDHSNVYALTFDHDFDWADLTISTSDFKRSLVDTEDYSTSFQFFGFLQSIGAFPIFAIPAGGELLAPMKSDLWANEARIHTKFQGPLNGVFGVYYADRKINYLNMVYATNPLTGTADPSWGNISSRSFLDRTKDLAVYGEATVELTDQLSVTGGVRWFDTVRDLDSETLVPFFGMGSPGVAPHQHSDNSGVIYKANVSYKVAPDAMIYAEYSEGYRAGGTNPSGSIYVPPQYNPDQTADYEIGAKTSWLDGRLIANAALYWIDLLNMQVPETFGPGGAFSGTGNISGSVATSKGFEADLTAIPLEGLTLTAAGNYTEATLTRDITAELGAAAIKGAALLNVPKVNLSFSGDYSFPVADGYTGDVGGVVTYTGGVKYHRYDDYNLPTSSYMLVNLRASVSWEKYEATLYANNLLDKNAEVNVFNDVNDAHVIFTNQPRTVGIRLSAHW